MYDVSKVIGFYEDAIVKAAEAGGLSRHDREELLDGLEALRPHVHPKRYASLKRRIKAQHVIDSVSTGDFKADLRLERPNIGYTLRRAKKAILGHFRGVVAYVMFGLVVGFAVMVICACVAQAGSGDSNDRLYPKTMYVTALQETNDPAEEGGRYLVVLKDAHGFTYKHYTDDGDWDMYETYSCIMDDMGTRQIVDDEIVSMRYERLDLLRAAENRRNDH